jgi:hypothetical protein
VETQTVLVASYLRVFPAIVNDTRNRQKIFQHPLIVYVIVAPFYSCRCNIQKKLAQLELNLGEMKYTIVAYGQSVRKIPTAFAPV